MDAEKIALFLNLFPFMVIGIHLLKPLIKEIWIIIKDLGNVKRYF